MHARFPVRALIPDSKAYLYYEPKIRAEDQGTKITIGFDNQSYDIDDLVDVFTNWLDDGLSGKPGDFNYDGQVNLEDLAELALHWKDS